MLRSAGARITVVARQSLHRSRAALCTEYTQNAPAFFWGGSERLIHNGWLKQTPFPFRSASPATSVVSKDMEAEIEHATGLEREELVAQMEGKSRFELEPPRGPFGTAEAPAVVEAQFDERLVGCSGGIGEEEHDVVWFKLKKDSLHSCSVCGQVFKLKVVGEGGLPGHHH